MFIPDPAFTVTRLRDGYDMTEVDDAIDALRVRAGREPPQHTRAWLESVRFSSARLSGYDMAQVDDWIEHMCEQLAPSRGDLGATPPQPRRVIRPGGTTVPLWMVLTLVACAIGLVLYLAVTDML